MENLAFEASEARYVQLADELTKAIHEGRFGPSGRLPTEADLSRRHAISRVTVRQAMAVLEKRGLIVRRRGLGTFVASHKIRQDLTRFGGFYEALVAQGLDPQMRLHDWRPVATSPEVAAKLRADSAMLLVRHYTIDGKPLAVHYTHLLPAAKTVSRDDAEHYPAYQILEKILHYTIDHADLTIRADSAGESPARLLGVKASDPVLILDRTSYSTSGEPLENTAAYLRSDFYEFALTVRGGVSLTRNVVRAASVELP
jgi:GntR family transcriptional regulator